MWRSEAKKDCGWKDSWQDHTRGPVLRSMSPQRILLASMKTENVSEHPRASINALIILLGLAIHWRYRADYCGLRELRQSIIRESILRPMSLYLSIVHPIHLLLCSLPCPVPYPVSSCRSKPNYGLIAMWRLLTAAEPTSPADSLIVNWKTISL